MSEDSLPKPAAAAFKHTEDFSEAYANNVRFESTVLDLKMIFGQSDQGTGREIIEQHTAVTIPWPLVKTFIYFLALNLIGHESQNGPINIPTIHVPPAIVPPTEEERKQLMNSDALYERLKDFREAFLSGKFV
jgi:hypothetical protein